MVFWGCIIFFVLLTVINVILSCKLASDADDRSEKMFNEYKEKIHIKKID